MAFSLTDDQKIGHLLRRFGFGASLKEMEAYRPLGVDGTLDKLLDLSSSKDILHSYQFAFKKDEEAEPGGYRFRLHWMLQMVMTETPLREKLALFWHDHFAVSEGDVEHGIALDDYMRRLRTDPAGKFRTILGRMVKSPALLRQLNVEMLSKTTPNENFGRELLELYTLGEGNYTEDDIQQVTMALTGWAHMDHYWQLGETNDARLRSMIANQSAGLFFVIAPDAHVPGPKKVLGKTVESGDDVLDMLAKHPQTATYICTKLWNWFGAETVAEPAVKRMADTFLKTDGDIAAVLREMTKCPEFWSQECYRKQMKNPVDYVVGMCRAMDVQSRLKEAIPETKFDVPVPPYLLEQLYGIAYSFAQTGMDILYPPDVSGWQWGNGWVSTNTMTNRRQFRGIATYYPVEVEGKTEWKADKPTQYMIDEIKKRDPKDTDALVHAFLKVFDCPLSQEQFDALKAHFDKHGGVSLMPHADGFAWICTVAITLLGASPEYQLC